MRLRHPFVALVLAVVAAGLPVRPPVAEARPETSGPAASNAEVSSVLVRFRAALGEERFRAIVSEHGAQLGEAVAGTGFFVVSPGARSVENLRSSLAGDPRVAAVEPNYVRRAAAVPNDLYYSSAQASYLDTIRLPAAWDLTTGAENLVLAVVDSGVDLEHPDLVDRLLPGHDFVDGDDSANDEFGHGTQVATIAAATTNNRTGLAGVAWQGKVLPVRVLDAAGRGNDAGIAAGITWAADHGADVINLSFGAPQPSQTLAEAVDYARRRDAVIVSAAGNSGGSSSDFPAALDGVIAVSATDRQGNFAWFSNYGPSIDVAAPGVDILAGTFDGPYQRMQGTSYAAALVAGVALLARARFPGDSADAIIERVRNGARDAGPLGIDDYFGYGLVDALGALGGPLPERRIDPAALVREPDNTPDRASALSSSATASLAPEGDVDWFFTDVGSARWVNFSVTPPTSGGAQRMDAVLELYGPGLRLMERVDKIISGGREDLNIAVGPGRYYLRVSNLTPSASPGPYQVRVEEGVDPNAPVFGFRSVGSRALPAEAASVAVGDLTGDGATDVLVSTEGDTAGDHRLFLFPQSGGTLGPPRSVPTGGTGDSGRDMGLALGDVDGDGDLDAAVATAAGVELHHQSGGGLGPPVLVGPAGATQAEIGDVDGDGRQDLVVATASSGIRLLRNRGDGGFDASTVTSAFAPEIEVADVNGDGRHDIAAWECAAGTCEEVAVHTSQAGGGFSRTATTVNGGLEGFSLGVGDWTRDGRPDVVASNGRGVSVLAQVGGTFPVRTGWYRGCNECAQSDPVTVEVTDVHGDGLEDIVVLYGGVGEVLVNSNNDTGWYTSIIDGGHHSFGPKGLAVGDIDSDGRVDLVTADRDSGLLTLRQATPLPEVPQDPGGERLWVRDTTPADGSTGAGPTVAPALRFARPLDPSSVTPASAILTDGSNGSQVPADVRYEPATNSVVLQPREPLLDRRPYLVRVAGLRDSDGYTMPPSACCLRFLVGDPPGGAAAPSPWAPAVTPGPDRSGYWMLGADGRVYPFGDAAGVGEATGLVSGSGGAVDLEPTPSGAGYWILDAAGHVFGFGAPYHGGVDPAVLRTGESVTSLSATPTGAGYWIFTTAGRAFAFGDAAHQGDMSGIRLNGPVLDSIATPSGRGYYMVASDGGIFAFGDAVFHGSMGATRLNAPVQSLVPDGDGDGYWLVASDGGVFSFDAPFKGSLGAIRLNRPVTGMVRYGDGYLMVGEDGGIFNFSNLAFTGSLGANPPAHPIVAVAAVR